MGKKKTKPAEELAKLSDMSQARDDALASAKKQITTVFKVSIGVLVVSWLLAFGFATGLKTPVPYYVALGLTVATAIAAFLIKRNLDKSEALGDLLADGADLSAEERDARIASLQARVEKGDSAAIIARAQLEMHDAPKKALVTLERVDLQKANKIIANQIRGMRIMIHLNLGELAASRKLADDVDLAKTPDLKARANLAGVVAEAWARSGNPIEGNELLDKYDPDHKDFQDVKVQLLRARVFASVHQNKLDAMKRALKQMTEISPQLLALFVGQKRIHPLLAQEAKKRLEKSGIMPRQKVQGARR